MDIIQDEQRYQLIKLTLDTGDSIETTAEHPFYIKGKGWNPANSLKVGEALQLHNGTTVVIKQIETGIRVEKVYNLTVANTHNYFVGEDGVLVHNGKKGKGKGKCSKKSEKERATDIPSWAEGLEPDSGESVEEFLKRILDDKYGPGNWKKGGGSEYSKIKKHLYRG